MTTNEPDFRSLNASIDGLCKHLKRCQAAILACSGPAFSVAFPDLVSDEARGLLAEGIVDVSYNDADVDGRRTHFYHGALSVDESTIALLVECNELKKALSVEVAELKARLGRTNQRLPQLHRYSLKMLTRQFAIHRATPYLVSFTWANRDRSIVRVADAEEKLLAIENEAAVLGGLELLSKLPNGAVLVRTQKLRPNLRTVSSFRVDDQIIRETHKTGLPLIFLKGSGEPPRFKVNEQRPRPDDNVRSDKSIEENVYIHALKAQINHNPRRRRKAQNAMA